MTATNSMVRMRGNYVEYGYDDIGKLTSATGKEYEGQGSHYHAVVKMAINLPGKTTFTTRAWRLNQ